MNARAIQIELTKLRSIGLPWALLSASSALTLLVALLEASRAGVHTSRLAVGPLNTARGLAGVISTPEYATLLALVLGVTAMTGEFRHATITTTYLAFPSRVGVLVAKMVASGTVGALFGLVASIITTAVGLGFVAARHETAALATTVFIRDAGGDILGCALLAALGVVIGTLIANQVVAIIAAFAWSLLGEGILYGISSSMAAYLPYSAARQLAGQTLSGVPSLPFAAGAALIAAITIALAAVATRTTVSRDIS